jgi:hypothetical protein
MSPPLAPISPTDPENKLQRHKGHSRRTFKFRKTRKEVSIIAN